jgi:high-affinity Fe2+/Pb2+ permease
LSLCSCRGRRGRCFADFTDFRLSLTLISRIDLRRGGESLLMEILGYPTNAEVAPAMRGLIIAVVVIVVIAVVAYFLLSRRRRP